MDHRSLSDWVLSISSPLVKFFSAEWLLTGTKRPNGGDIVFLRALITAAWIYILAIALKNGFDLIEMRGDVGPTVPWFGGIFAATYFTYYSRFSSQWMYLATLFNQINGIEARTARDSETSKMILDKWKAGFLEDAEDLHLATKRIFVSVVRRWGHDQDVAKHYEELTPFGKARLKDFIKDVDAAYELYEKQEAAKRRA